MLICKANVRFKRITPAMMILLNALYRMDQLKLDGQPDDIVITSANDSKHMAKSRHYTDEALDVRSKTFADEAAKARFVTQLRAQLGTDFTVLYEGKGTPNQHFHVQVRRHVTIVS